MGADERPCLSMFESKEEVERTMLALKIFPDIDQVVEAEQDDPETDEEEYAPQVFPEHTAAETRYTRGLYYGALPATDRPSLPLTRLAVDQFTSTGLDALEQHRQQLNRTRALWLSELSNAPPTNAPDRSPWAELPSAPGTYSMPIYRDRPDTVTNHGPALPPLLSQAWRGSEAWREERSALHQLGLQAPKPGLQYRGRCPVLRWGSTTLRWGSVAAWPLLLTPG